MSVVSEGENRPVVEDARGARSLLTGARAHHGGQQPVEISERNWLQEMRRKAKLCRTDFVGRACIPRERDELQLLVRVAQPLTEIVTVHVRQTDVEKRDLGLELGRDGERRSSVEGGAHDVADVRQPEFDQLGGVLVVIDDEHTVLHPEWVPLRLGFPSIPRASVQQGAYRRRHEFRSACVDRADVPSWQ